MEGRGKKEGRGETVISSTKATAPDSLFPHPSFLFPKVFNATLRYSSLEGKA